MKYRLWLFVLFLGVSRKPATAGIASAMKAEDLMEKCRYAEADFKKLNSTELSDINTCMSYISGVVDGYAVGVVTSSRERTMLCDMPDDVTLKQIALIVLHYGKENPGELHSCKHHHHEGAEQVFPMQIELGIIVDWFVIGVRNSQ